MNRAYLDYEMIGRNILQFSNYTDKDIMCVIKSNAYGHGLIETAKTLYSNGVSFFSTYYLKEAIEVKEILPESNVLHLGPVFTVEELILISKYEINLMISSMELLRKIDSCSDLLLRPIDLHIKFDTGLCRNGINHSNFDDLKAEMFSIFNNSKINCLGVMSHLMMTDLDSIETKSQIKEFEYICAQFVEHQIDNSFFHLGNTSYLFHEGDKYSNLIRIGIGIYGLSCGIEYNKFGLDIKPVMTFKSKIISSKKVKKGDKISYGGKFTADGDLSIAVVAAGYADGLPRISSKDAYVIVKGNKCRILGVICMNNFVIDVSGMEKKLDIGTDVIIFSDGRNNTPTADDWSSWSDSIGYDIVTKVGNLNRRVSMK